MSELSVREVFALGIAAHKAGDVQAADRYYTAVLQTTPDHPGANHNIGILLVGFGNYKEALPFFQKAIEVDQSVEQYWISLIDNLIKLGQRDEAENLIARAKGKSLSQDLSERLEKRIFGKGMNGAAEPLQEETAHLLALYNQGQMEKVIATGKTLGERYPEAFMVWNSLGAANKRLGFVEDSLRAFTQAMTKMDIILNRLIIWVLFFMRQVGLKSYWCIRKSYFIEAYLCRSV